MIVNPWGEVVAQLGGEKGEPEIATADIDLEAVETIRREMPLLRRTCVAKLWFRGPRSLMRSGSDVYPEI